MITASDFEAVAYARLPRQTYDYMAYGVESEFTLRRNRQVFDWVELIPRAVADVSSIQTATEILGTKMAYPIMIAPSSAHGSLWPEGEMATHKGATAASNTTMIVSNVATFPLDKIAAAATGPLWFQLYPRQDIDGSRQTIESAQASGCKAIAMTVDQQASYYERIMHDRHLAGPPLPGGIGGRQPRTRNPYHVPEARLWYSWKYVEQIRPFLKVPLLAKGILTSDDAKACVEHGLDGIIVSNHGGRSLDYGPSTLEVLPEIVDAVQGKIPVLIDSGFRSGSDILKALAIGAKAVCLGRTIRWGLASYGALGVQRVLEILQAELVQAMADTGRPTLASIDHTLVRTHFA
jgi:isopentenyl diphosphate isomerase/L-lactate dehydrogenase-like FMN-dependent dehydrogenase